MVGLMNLPTELLLEILSNLDYGDLKFTIPATNRRLNDITSSLRNSLRASPSLNEDLAESLFLESARKIKVRYTVSEGENYLYTYYETGEPVAYYNLPKPTFMLHPCFKHLRLRNDSVYPSNACIDDIGFLSCDGTFVKLTETETANENAMKPASPYTQIHTRVIFAESPPLKMGTPPGEWEQEPEVITVSDLVQAILSETKRIAMSEMESLKGTTLRNAKISFRPPEIFNTILLLSVFRIDGGGRGEGYVVPWVAFPFDAILNI